MPESPGSVLQKAERHLEREQAPDDRRLQVLAETDLDDDRGFQQPRDRSPDLCQRGAPGRGLSSAMAFGPSSAGRRRASSPVKPAGLSAPEETSMDKTPP
jgi:hypothetical protein